MKQAVKYQNIGLWVIQIGIGLLFAFSGAVKLFGSIQKLAEQIIWPGDVPFWLTRFIGISEVLGGIGLILPMALRIQKKLTAWAALGLMIIMLLAAVFHLIRSEMAVIPMNLILAALCAVIIWKRGFKN